MMKIEITVDSLFPPRLVFESLLLRMTHYGPVLSDAEAQEFLRKGKLDVTFMDAPVHFEAFGVEGEHN